MENKSSALRELLASEKIVVAPGCFDCLSARIVQSLGFNVVYLTGFGMEASRLGKPDIGLASMTEVVDLARSVVESVSVPVICDADTGYGGALNVWRTVREFARAGVAAIHIEDQTSPKKCGALPGKTVLPPDEMVAKIRAATDARGDGPMMIIARTDAMETLGLDDTTKRLARYVDAGADLGMVAGDFSLAELKEMASAIPGKFVITSGTPRRKHNQAWSEYADLGIKVVLYPLSGLLAAAKAVHGVYSTLQQEKGLSEKALARQTITFDQVNGFLGLDDWNLRADRFNAK